MLDYKSVIDELGAQSATGGMRAHWAHALALAYELPEGDVLGDLVEATPEAAAGRFGPASGKNAAAQFLERVGFEILERDFGTSHGVVDFIAQDCQGIHFISFGYIDSGTEFANADTSREARERAEAQAIEYLAGSDLEPDFSVLFDFFSITRTSNHSAAVRFHKNIFGDWK